MKKMGVSPVIATILLVGLAVVLVGVVWTIVNGLVQDQTQQASACFGIFDKVVLNEKYTCYSPDDDTLQVSIDVKDVDVDSVLVSIEGEEETKTFELSSTPLSEDIPVYNQDGSQAIIPPKNGGKIYSVDSSFGEGLVFPPKTIKISPKIKGYQCDVSSAITQIEDC